MLHVRSEKNESTLNANNFAYSFCLESKLDSHFVAKLYNYKDVRVRNLFKDNMYMYTIHVHVSIINLS